MTEAQLALFDYAALDAETRIVVQQEDKEFDRNMGEAGSSFIHACHNLKRIQTRLRYARPGFVDYAESKPGLGKSTAYRMISIAELFPNLGNISIESPSALYLLAAPSTPEPARAEALDRASAGEVITHKTAQAIVNAHRAHVGSFDPDDTLEYQPSYDDVPSRPLDEIDAETGEILTRSNMPTYTPPTLASNGRQKPKLNRASEDDSAPFDRCQTPAYALDPLLPFLSIEWLIWEPASGEGLLAGTMMNNGLSVLTSDILGGTDCRADVTGFDFLNDDAPQTFDAQVTNPPYSKKYDWLARSYALGKPFALLLPVETLGAKTAQALFREYGVEVILMDSRINFKMPKIGWNGSSAQFPVAWFTWGLNIGQQLTFAHVEVIADDR